MNLELLNKVISFTKDNGNYQNNMGIRTNELNNVKTRISDIIFNFSLLQSVIVSSEAYQKDKEKLHLEEILTRIEKDIENFKLLEENIANIVTLMNTDTNSAKYITRAMLKDLEKFKESNYHD